jgi:uncharacterized protein YbbK (DUF523 family)
MDHFLRGEEAGARSGFPRTRFYHPHSATVRPRVAISACLAGEQVRYDGASRPLSALAWLAERLQLVPVCPEVGAGLGVPRPPVQLVASGGSVVARGRDDPTLDVTAALTTFARMSSTNLPAAGPLCGYLLKSRSPSCGLDSTPLFAANGVQIGTTSGIQAAHFQSRLPWLSYCEETTLDDRTAALAFELRCRLVFDWLHAVDTPAVALQRHYQALLQRLEPPAPIPMDRNGFLTALQCACAKLPPAQLLELFEDWTA